MSEYDEEDEFPFLRHTNTILFWALYVDYIFAMWDWVDPVPFFNLLDKIHYTFLFSSVILLAYVFPRIYELGKKAYMCLVDEIDDDEEIVLDIIRMDRIYNLMFAAILFILSRISELFSLNPTFALLYIGIILGTYFLGIYVIREFDWDSREFGSMILYGIAFLVFSYVQGGGEPAMFFFPQDWGPHITISVTLTMVIFSCYGIFSVYFTSKYIVNKKMVGKGRDKLEQDEDVTWKDFIYHMIAVLSIYALLIIFFIYFNEVSILIDSFI